LIREHRLESRAGRKSSLGARPRLTGGGRERNLDGREASRMKLRPSLIARTFPVPATSNRQAVNGRSCVRAAAVGRTTAPTMHEIQQNRARATFQRPPIQQRNRRNGAALRRGSLGLAGLLSAVPG
jgi:hypothetical protein